ncbi:hypothetical protein GCM10027605_33620 [Micromonospora zhanjiangensis]
MDEVGQLGERLVGRGRARVREPLGEGAVLPVQIRDVPRLGGQVLPFPVVGEPGLQQRPVHRLAEVVQHLAGLGGPGRVRAEPDPGAERAETGPAERGP